MSFVLRKLNKHSIKKRLNLLFYYIDDIRSSLRRIENMNVADNKHIPTKTAQTPQTGNTDQNKPTTPTSILPIAVAANQPPIIEPLYFGGATFDTNEIPIGLKNNSAIVNIK